MVKDRLLTVAAWGFPISETDLREFVKEYLNKKGTVSKVFKDNKPTHMWVKRFLGRHKEISLRTANPLKRSRAKLSKEEVVAFINNWAETIQGVPPSNIVNYDETNMRDDPGSSKCFFRKGTKYCEKVENTSKQAISVMFAGTADGKLLPPMVVYKAANLYDKWKEGGPKGTVYSFSKSGWYDSYQFRKWFFKVTLPYLKRLPGKKVLLGDNLASHLSVEVVEACKRNDIAFVCLPPNSTDKLQPLDVAMFGPFKHSWKSVLRDHNEKRPRDAGINKGDFPSLLLKNLERADYGKNLAAGLAACGLFPISQKKALTRIPSRDMDVDRDTIRELMDSTLGEQLEKLRGVDGQDSGRKKRGKKVKVQPGRSYTMEEEDEMEEREEEEVDDVEGGTGSGTGTSRKRPVGAGRHWHRYNPAAADDDDTDEGEDEEEEEYQQQNQVEDEDEGQEAAGAKDFTVGSYVAAVYDQLWYVAQVEGEEEEEETEGFTLLRYMKRKGNNQFYWDNKIDILKTNNRDILLSTEAPIPVSSRYWGMPKNVAAALDILLRSPILWLKIFKLCFIIVKKYAFFHLQW